MFNAVFVKKIMKNEWLRSFRTVSILTALSRITGYVRDSALGLWIGPGIVLDAFFVVMRIASMGRAYFAEGMVNAMVPVLAQEESLDAQKKLIGAMACRVSAMLFIVCCCVSFFPTFFLQTIAPGFALDERMVYASHFLGVMFWYLLQINIISMMNALFHVHGRFAIPSFLPMIINVLLIIAAWGIAYCNWPFMSLAYAVIIAGILQMACIMTMTYQVFGSWKAFAQIYHPRINGIFTIMGAACAGTGIVQVSSLLDTFLATSLQAGAVSWVYYADRLVQLPLGILGVSMMTVLLPKLSSDHAAQQQESYQYTFCLGFECMMMLSMPMACFLAILNQDIIATLFGYGKFSAHDVYQTSLCLRWMSLALPAIMLNKLIAASSYAKGHISGLVQASILGVVCNGIFAWTMMGILQQQAMALGMLLGAWVNIIWLYRSASPIAVSEMWERCRIFPWMCAWFGVIVCLVCTRYFLAVHYDMGYLMRCMTLCGTVIPAGIFYSIFMVYMWRPTWLMYKVTV